MNILIGCECSGRIRDAFAARGHNAVSCDLIPSKTPGKHYQGDVRDLLRLKWDMAIFHPDCTYLCSSGLHWNTRVPGREALTEAAVAFALELWNCSIPKVVLENPRGRLGRFLGKSQTIHPHEYGHDASKTTCLWKRGGVPDLVPTKHIAPRIVWLNGKPYKRWANQTDSGQNKLPPTEDRWFLRAETYQGWADAMADQWGGQDAKQVN